VHSHPPYPANNDFYKQQQQSFNGPLSGTTRVSQYQKKCSPTHHPDNHPIFISFFHVLPLHRKVQKFSSGTGSPGWSRKKGHKMDACVSVPSTMIHSILPVQITCLAIFLHNLTLLLVYLLVWSPPPHLHPISVFFS